MVGQMKNRVLAVVMACFLVGASVSPAVTSAGSSPAKGVLARAEPPSEKPGAASAEKLSAAACDLPAEQKSVRFAVIGDSGTGENTQFQVGQQMENCRLKTNFDFVLMLGDNIYGGKSEQDFSRKFELPYKPLLDAGVKFYASLGNHDNPNERLYKPFNMGGARYYMIKKGNVTFFALDSSYMDRQQLDWLELQLKTSDSPWKICYFHHPLYSDGKFHGPDLDLRATLTPLFEKYGVNVVLSGHEHVYERIKPVNDIYYFVLGNSGELRVHNLKPSANMQAGFDVDLDFMLVDITGDSFNFQTISRTGQVVDSGTLQRPPRR